MVQVINRKQGSPLSGDSETVLLSVLQEVAVELHPQRPRPKTINLDSSLERDLGLDSLARVELFARLEKHYGVALPEAAFASAETPRDLLRALASARHEIPSITAEPTRLVLGEAEPAPHSARTLVEVLDWHVQTHPDRPHIQLYTEAAETETISYRQLKDGAAAIAAGLQQIGLQAGQIAAIMLPTGRDYFFSFYGVVLAGGIPVPIYPPARLTQLEDHLRRHGGILSNCLASILITVPEGKRVARLLKSHVETLRHVVTPEELAAGAPAFTAPVLRADDIAFLQYTSGSTGNPKGVVLTHANLLANIRAIGQALEVDSTDVVVSWLPLYHDMGLIGAWLGSLYYAVMFVSMSPLAFLSRPQRWLWAIHQHRATISAAPNFAYGLCLHRIEDSDIEGLDLSSWRIAFNGAEAVSPATVERFAERFSRFGFRREAMYPVYGLAECSVALTFPPLHRAPLIDAIQRDRFMQSGEAVAGTAADKNLLHFVSCGRPLAGHEVRIVDPTGHELPERESGRLQFRGPSTTSGYFRNAEATRSLFDGDWLESGDLAYIAGGEVYITGRIKDVIIHSGRNIYPHELEEAVGDIPGIRKGCVAVFGTEDPVSGTERLAVLAETREQDKAVQETLRVRINTAVIDLIGAAPDNVILAPPHTIPKTSSGKIRRAASREVYESGRLKRPPRALWWQIVRLSFSAVLPEWRRARRVAVAGLYATYASGLFWLVAPIVWAVAVLLPRNTWRWRVMRAGARFLARAVGVTLRVHGLEQLPPRDQPCIYVVNHASYVDGFMVVAGLPREYSFVAKNELQQKFVPSLFLRRIEAEFVERFDKQQGIADARRVARATQTGRSLMFFPEGTLTRAPGIMPFHMGAFVAAVETGVPLVPIALRGTRSVLRPDSWRPHRGAVTLIIGVPLDPAKIKEQTGGDPWKAALKCRDAAREHILRYSGEPDLAGEHPPPF